MVLLDAFIPIIDEVAALIRESGGPSHPPFWDSIGPFPPWLSTKEREAAEQRAISEGLLRHRAEVEEPAEAILRERKAAHPSAVRKLVAFGDDEGAHYRAVLEGIELDLSRVAHPPGVTSLALRVSSEGRAAVREFHGRACVAGANLNIIAIYVGPYRPATSQPGFYLVFDSWSNSLAAVPPLPPSYASSFTHRGMGSGAGVLRHGHLAGDYVLAELLAHSGGSSKASLFTWWSFGPAAGQWIQHEVVLPFPFPNFCADTIFAIEDNSMCWVDLLSGILICHDILTDDPKFQFLPLPEGYSSDWEPDHGRGRPGEFRSMCYDLLGNIKFIHIDTASFIITMWTLGISDWKWKKGGSLHILDIWADPTYKQLKLPEVAPRCPILSLVKDEGGVVYLYVAVEKDQYVFSVDVQRGRVLSGLKLPQGCRHTTHILGSEFSIFLNSAQPSSVVEGPSGVAEA